MGKLNEKDIDILQWLIERKISDTKEILFNYVDNNDDETYNFYKSKLKDYYLLLDKIMSL